MNLIIEQLDAITELFNIAFARTVKSLSDITGFHVMLEVPDAKLHPLGDLILQLTAQMKTQEVVTIQQTFAGQLSGTAILLLDYDAALGITDLVTVGYTPHLHRLDHASCEVLTEIGNILLNACLSSLGNLLQLHVGFSVPRLQLREVEILPDSLASKTVEQPYTLSVGTQFQLHNISIKGHLILVLEETALAQLLSAVDRWVDRPILLASASG